MADTPRPLSPKQVERLNAKSTGTAIKWMSKAQTWLFKASGGKLGNKFLRGAEVGILTTTGRKSGQPRTTPTLYLRDGDRIVLPAPYGGRDHHPAWYLNITAHPKVQVQVGPDVREMTARDATDDERRVYWPKLTRIYPPYKGYQDAADRRIPLVVCEPV